jgi:hypothetical protein
MKGLTNEEEQILYSIGFNLNFDGEFEYQHNRQSMVAGPTYDNKYYLSYDWWEEDCDTFDELIGLINETKTQ